MKLGTLTRGIANHGFEISIVEFVGEKTHDFQHIPVAGKKTVPVVGLWPFEDFALEAEPIEEVFEIRANPSPDVKDGRPPLGLGLLLNNGVKPEL